LTNKARRGGILHAGVGCFAPDPGNPRQLVICANAGGDFTFLKEKKLAEQSDVGCSLDLKCPA
jgi:hypothetical protein